MQFESAAEAKVEYTAMLLGATGNVGGYILHLLVQRLGLTRVRASSRKMNTLMDASFASRRDSPSATSGSPHQAMDATADHPDPSRSTP